MANLLNNYRQDVVDAADYFDLLKIYTKSHQLTREDGKVVPWIDENLNPRTGDWIARTRLKTWNNGTWDAGKGGKERGKDYNHSTYCDLVITGLVGLRPRSDAVVEVHPLAAGGHLGLVLPGQRPLPRAHAHDPLGQSGEKYGRGKGLRVFADGAEIAHADSLERVTGALPGSTAGTSAGWTKYEGGPVLGGDLGTCFDVAMLRENETYRMWFSWRPKESIALVESQRRNPLEPAADRFGPRQGHEVGRRHQPSRRGQTPGRLSHVVHGAGQRPQLDRLRDQSRRRPLDPPLRPSRSCLPRSPGKASP